MPETTDNIILIAKVSQVLSRRDIIHNQALNGYTLDDRHPILLRMERMSLEYAKKVNSPSLFEVGEYVLALCGKYAFEARKIIALSNTGNITSSYNTMAREIIFFQQKVKVGEGGSALKAGDVSYDILLPDIIEESVDVEMPQSNVPQGEVTQFSWTILYTKQKATVIFLNYDENNVNLGVQDGMMILIYGARYAATGDTGTGGGGTGGGGNTTGLPILVVTGSQIFNNQYQNSDYIGQKVLLYHNGIARYLDEGQEYVTNPLGGWVFINDYVGINWQPEDRIIMIPNGPL